MYEKTVKLQDYERLCKVDTRTGEVNPFGSSTPLPDDKRLHKFPSFAKVNERAIKFLETVLSNEELGIVMKMVSRAQYGTNIMLPLNDESSLRQLSDEFGVNRRRIEGIFTKLFKLGVYAQVRVANGVHQHFWTLNPYISWKGRVIEKSIDAYFSNTIIAKQCV